MSPGNDPLKTAHLFVIDPAVRKAMSPEEVAAICSDLRTLELFRLPFENCTLQFLADDMVNWVSKDPASDVKLGPQCVLQIGPLSLDGAGTEVTLIDFVSGYKTSSATDLVMLPNQTPEEIGRLATAGLIALLATRNAVKSTKENKLAKLGIGKQKRFAYVTTICLPRPEDMDDDADHAPTGVARAPHLRRGHIRNQHFGPANAFVKLVWIAPTFVNADPAFVSTRKAYNVVGGTHAPVLA